MTHMIKFCLNIKFSFGQFFRSSFSISGAIFPGLLFFIGTFLLLRLFFMFYARCCCLLSFRLLGLRFYAIRLYGFILSILDSFSTAHRNSLGTFLNCIFLVCL